MNQNNKNKTEPSLRKEIGQLGFSAIALNGTIGAGIFALPAIAVGRAGLFSPWIYFICGFLIMLIVLVFARVSSYFKDTGGPVTYATTAFGPFAGFQTGVLLTLSRAAAFAANSHLMVTYAGWFWPPLGEADGTVHMTVTALVVLVLAAINIVGVKQGMAAIFAMTVLKLLPLVLLVVLGISQVTPEIFSFASIPPIDSLGETMLIVFYAFVGFESAVIPAGEGKNAQRDIPLALIRTILAVAAFYFLIQWVTLSVTPDAASSNTPLADVAMVLMGGTGALLLTLGAVFSITGNLSAGMLSAPRMIYAMGHQGNLPVWFGGVHPRFETPARAIATYGLLSLLLALSGGFVLMAVISTVVRLLVYVMCIAALPVLRNKLGEDAAQFKLPGGLLIPGLAFIISVWLMTHAKIESWYWTGGFMLATTIVYLLMKRFRRSTSGDATA